MLCTNLKTTRHGTRLSLYSEVSPQYRTHIRKAHAFKQHEHLLILTASTF